MLCLEQGHGRALVCSARFHNLSSSVGLFFVIHGLCERLRAIWRMFANEGYAVSVRLYTGRGGEVYVSKIGQKDRVGKGKWEVAGR